MAAGLLSNEASRRKEEGSNEYDWRQEAMQGATLVP